MVFCTLFYKKIVKSYCVTRKLSTRGFIIWDEQGLKHWANQAFYKFRGWFLTNLNLDAINYDILRPSLKSSFNTVVVLLQRRQIDRTCTEVFTKFWGVLWCVRAFWGNLIMLVENQTRLWLFTWCCIVFATCRCDLLSLRYKWNYHLNVQMQYFQY